MDAGLKDRHQNLLRLGSEPRPVAAPHLPTGNHLGRAPNVVPNLFVDLAAAASCPLARPGRRRPAHRKTKQPPKQRTHLPVRQPQPLVQPGQRRVSPRAQWSVVETIKLPRAVARRGRPTDVLAGTEKPRPLPPRRTSATGAGRGPSDRSPNTGPSESETPARSDAPPEALVGTGPAPRSVRSAGRHSEDNTTATEPCSARRPGPETAGPARPDGRTPHRACDSASCGDRASGAWQTERLGVSARP